MDSAKPTMAVALADERLGKGWRRPQTRIRVVAVVTALVAAAIVFSLFDRFRVQQGEAKPQRQLIGTIDLGIGNEAGSFARGEAQARNDIARGSLKLRVEEPNTPPTHARAKQIEKRYGIVWITNGDVDARGNDARLAFVLGYNHVVEAEIERRHGKGFLDRLIGGEEDAAVPDKGGQP